MMRKVEFVAALVVALLAAFACSPGGDVSRGGEGGGTAAAPPGKAGENAGELVVYAPKVNLRAGPSSSADVVAVLDEGTYAEVLPDKRVEGDGYDWARVRADGEEGWVAEKFVIPASIYEATRKAHELGRGGDAAAMVAELERVTAERGGKAEDISVSPDGNKVLCRLLNDPGDETVGTDLYFAAGRGLVDNAGESLFMGTVAWSADGRYFVRGGNFVAMSPFRVYDAKRNRVTLGGESYGDNFAFAGGYFVFLTTEPSEAVKDAGLPAMYYVTLPGGKMRKILGADAGDARGRAGTREYRLRPIGKAPLAVAASALYRTYADHYAPSYVSEEQTPSDVVRQEITLWVERFTHGLSRRR